MNGRLLIGKSASWGATFSGVKGDDAKLLALTDRAGYFCRMIRRSPESLPTAFCVDFVVQSWDRNRAKFARELSYWEPILGWLRLNN